MRLTWLLLDPGTKAETMRVTWDGEGVFLARSPRELLTFVQGLRAAVYDLDEFLVRWLARRRERLGSSANEWERTDKHAPPAQPSKAKKSRPKTALKSR